MKRPEDSFLLFAVVGLAIAASFAEEPTPIIATTSSAVVAPTSASVVPAPSSSEATTTTHAIPTITPTASPSPSPSSSPSPSPQPGASYTVNDEQNKSCILFSAEMIQLTLNYATTDNTTREVMFNLTDSNTELDRNKSVCRRSSKRGHSANLTINWCTSSLTQSLTFTFATETYTWKLAQISLDLNTTDNDFPNITNTSEFQFHSKKDIFSNEYQRSYKCDKSQTFTLGNSNSNLTAINETSVELVAIWRMQAFDFRRNDEFGNPRICPQSVVKNVKLPAIVGGVLFLLLIAVVVVYIISRFRRRKLSSYEALK